MSLLSSYIDPQRVICKAHAASRKRVLETIADNVAAQDPNTSAHEIFDGLLARERLGSTSIGDGVAIPHCRQPIARIQICLVTTEVEVEYEATDGQAVDIFFALIVPEDEHQMHLRALADLSTILANNNHRARIRACSDNEALYENMLSLLGQISQAQGP